MDLLISVDLTSNLQIAVKSKLLGVERRDFFWLQVVFRSFSFLVICSHDSDYLTRIIVASHQIHKSSDVPGYPKS